MCDILYSGLEAAGSQTPAKQVQPSASVSNLEVPLQHSSNDAQSQSHWGENRLADVVKGTAKSKSVGGKEPGSVMDNESPRAASPHQAVQLSRHPEVPESKDVAIGNDEVIQPSTITLTPPSSPDKLVVFNSC